MKSSVILIMCIHTQSQNVLNDDLYRYTTGKELPNRSQQALIPQTTIYHAYDQH